MNCLSYFIVLLSLSVLPSGSCFLRLYQSSNASVGQFRIHLLANCCIEIIHSDQIIQRFNGNSPFIHLNYAIQFGNTINRRGNINTKEWTVFASHHQSVVGMKQRSNYEAMIHGMIWGSAIKATYEMRFYIPFREFHSFDWSENERLDAHLAFEIKVKAIAGFYNRILLTYDSNPLEHFYGFGVQYSVWNMKGRRVPIIVSEQGIGRGAEPITSLLNFLADGAGGDWSTTYAPKPYYITNFNSSVMLENSEISFFDLRKMNAVTVEVWSHQMKGRILYGRSMLDIITQVTEYTGRMEPLPYWSQKGAIIGLQGGSDIVEKRLDYILQNENRVPIAGIWIQDWVGQRQSFDGDRLRWNWQLDGSYYPRWKDMVAKLSKQGIRILVYLCPFFVNPEMDAFHTLNSFPKPKRNLYQEGRANGYFVKRKDGTTYSMLSGSIEFATIDLTNPAARAWMKDIIRQELIGNASTSGWMSDFGEYLPFDAVLYDGRTGAEYHNLYPQEWGRLNQEAVAELGYLSDEIVYFVRSGWMKSPAYNPLFWLGDQLVHWDHHDGLQSVIVGSLSAGLAGHSLVHSDIGGQTTYRAAYHAIYRSEEILLRWIELSAFGAALFRSHEGPSLSDSNAQIYSNQRLLNQFARFSQIFALLRPYRETLMDEAHLKGWPLMRSMAAHYSYDQRCWELTSQYLFGSELLIAPVIESVFTSKHKASAAARNSHEFSDYPVSAVVVYIPQHTRWIHIWSGLVAEGGEKGAKIFIDSPIGFPPVFYREGSRIGGRIRNTFHTGRYTLLLCREEKGIEAPCIDNLRIM